MEIFKSKCFKSSENSFMFIFKQNYNFPSNKPDQLYVL